ncbi:MAG TPA: CHAT domain-containing protein [Chthoniobacteraceae bacterium]|jgi:CHAT domain-containing protein|nr:CHAT domain-containing protein [Chthoniobacteraceae bacterium]
MQSPRSRWVPRLLCCALLCASAAHSATPAESKREAQALADRGSFEEAAVSWARLAEGCRRAKETDGLIDALLGQGAAQQALGRQRLAMTALAEAVELARQSNDRRRLISGLNLLGVAQTFSHAAEHAEEHFREAAKLAQAEGEPGLQATVANNLGILLAGQGKLDEAFAAHQKAAAWAARASPRLLTGIRCNLADVALRRHDFPSATQLNREAAQTAAGLENSHAKAFALAHCGQTWELIFAQSPAHEQKLRAEALNAYRQSAAVAEAIGDARALAYALGYTGHLYEQEKKYADAQPLTRRAAFLAQQARAPESLYLWEWQTARMDAAQGRREEAVAGYRRALRSLGEIRNDLSARLGNANARSSFREAVGDVFFELADLLLQRADGERDEQAVTAALVEARDTCETLKSVELEDYFQDDCVSLLRAKTKAVEQLAEGAAVIYLIPLKERTEIIVGTAGKLQRVKAAVGAAELTATVRAFRLHLETRTTEEYREEAERLYGWLIRPLEPLLAAAKADTLVFIPDGALRTIPMAALHDGKKFLVEKYAIAVTPGLTLMEATPIQRTQVNLLTNGMTEAVQRDGVQYPALPFVKEEIGGLQRVYGGTSLMNGDFRKDAMRDAVLKQHFSVVHIASHGEFTADASKSFVLTFDDRLGLNDLEQIIRPAQLRDQPVELLTLSACQTAAGDDRAALGLAGVAVKAGARAAFATLWYVNDEASTTLVSDFYRELHEDQNLSKAKALQRAQIKLLTQPRTSHPCLWAAYLMIGNWL